MKKIRNVLFLFFCIFILTGCSSTSEKNEETLMKEKTTTELQFIEDAVFNITNKYAKGEYLKDDELDWQSILDDEKKIDEVIETIILDLSEMNINQEDLILLSNELNNLLIVTLAEEESELLPKIQKVYDLVPKFLSAFPDEKNSIKEKELKSIV